MIRKLLIFLGLCVFVTGCSTGGYQGDPLKASTEGASTTRMGVRYLLGRGVEQNNEKAFSYFKKAAENEKDPFAENELAFMYAAGKGTRRDERKSFYWYQQAASHGLASAQYNLGLMYLNGLGTEPNKALALSWFEKSAAHGFEPAKQALQQHKG